MRRILLVVEDDLPLQKAYKEKLELAGFEVHLSTGSKEAFEIIKKITPDLIILDILIPGEGGLGVLTAIKSNPYLKDKPVLVISNLSKPDLIESVKKMGAVEFIVKANLSLTDLVTKINRLLPNQ